MTTMIELYRFLDAGKVGLSRQYTFTLHSGETRLLQLMDRDEKNEFIDLAVGDKICDEGSIEIIQGERRSGEPAGNNSKQERRQSKDSSPMEWQSLQSSRLGRVGWVYIRSLRAKRWQRHEVACPN